MKRFSYILFFAALLLGGVQSLFGQQLEVVDSAGYALVRYSFPVVKPRSAYSQTYLPMLRGRQDSLDLSPVIVRGATNEKIIHRDYVLNKRGKSEPQYIKGKNIHVEQLVSDSLQVALDSHPWVADDSLSLIVKIVEEGCCNVEIMPALYSAVLTPLHEPEVLPEIVDSPKVVDTPQIVVPPFVPQFALVDTFEPDSFAAELVKNNPVAIQFKDYKPYDRTVVLAKDSGALYVHFQLDKVVLLREFSNNAATLDRIMYMINSLMEDTTTSVKVIQIIGLASIEGNVPHNEWLASNRALALENYIKERIDTTGLIFEAAGGGEAWAEFRWLVEQESFEGRDRVLEIVDQDPDLNSRERWLKTINNGRTWTYLRQHILPPLRNSGYVKVYYDVKPDAKGIKINEGANLLQEQKYDEALRVLLQVADDERAQNALGVAYYMVGDRANAISCWRRAAAAGNDDAQTNLQQVIKENE